MKTGGKVCARLLLLCLALGHDVFTDQQSLHMEWELGVKWGRARTNWNLHLTLTTANLMTQVTCRKVRVYHHRVA